MSLFGNRTRKPQPSAHVDVPILVRVWQEDGVWNASAFDLNVAAFGNTFEEAQDNFAAALDAHFELLVEIRRAKQTIIRLRSAAQDRGFYDRIRPRETVTKYEIPSATAELCLA